jgi:TonB family protein
MMPAILFSCKNATEARLKIKTNRIMNEKSPGIVKENSHSVKQDFVKSSTSQGISASQKPVKKDSAAKISYPGSSFFFSGNKEFENPFQEILVTTKKDTMIKLKEGSSISIPAHSFVYEDDEKPAEGTITLLAKEFYKNSDIVMAGISTSTDSDILETGGMVYLEARSDGRKCTLAPGKLIDVGFQSFRNNKNMQLYSGYLDKNNKIIWKLSNENREQVVKEKPKAEIFTVVEEPPQFPGGDEAVDQFLRQNIKYSQEARELGIQGKVYLTYVVETDGSLSDIKVVRGLGGGCDEEAIRVVKSMPAWRPGMQRGNPVRVQYNLPVRFYSDNNSQASLSGTRNETQNTVNSYSVHREVRYDDTYSCILRSSRLGWLNCDRLLNFNNPRINFSVADENVQQTDMAMVFQRVKVILSPSFINNGRFVFAGVPINEKVTIVAIKKKDNKLFLSMKETVTSEVQENILVYKEVTSAELRSELGKLDR